nr:unnamed protein product [Callosobruchus analis]
MIVENVFGIMQPNRVTLTTLACFYLHNFLRTSKTSIDIYTPQDSFDSFSVNMDNQPGSWRNDSENITSLLPLQKIPQSGQDVRNEYANYFITNGRVDWYDKYN